MKVLTVWTSTVGGMGDNLATDIYALSDSKIVQGDISVVVLISKKVLI